MTNFFQTLKKTFGIFLALSFIVWCIYYISVNEGARETLASTRFEYILLASLFHFLSLWANGIFLRQLMTRCKIVLGQAEAVHLSILTSSANCFLPMTSGMAFRAYYLKKVHNFDITEFIAVTIGTYILNYLIVFFAGLVSSIGVQIIFGTWNLLPIAWFGFGFSSLLFVVLFDTWRPKFPFRIGRGLNRVIDSWDHIRKDRDLVVFLSIVTVANVVIALGPIYAGLLAIGKHLDIMSLFFLTSVDSLNLFIKITPGNVGVNEALLIYAGNVIGVSKFDMIVVSGISRVALYLLLIIATPISLYGLYGKSSLKALKKLLRPGTLDEPN